MFRCYLSNKLGCYSSPAVHFTSIKIFLALAAGSRSIMLRQNFQHSSAALLVFFFWIFNFIYLCWDFPYYLPSTNKNWKIQNPNFFIWKRSKRLKIWKLVVFIAAADYTHMVPYNGTFLPSQQAKLENPKSKIFLFGKDPKVWLVYCCC